MFIEEEVRESVAEGGKYKHSGEEELEQRREREEERKQKEAQILEEGESTVITERGPEEAILMNLLPAE